MYPWVHQINILCLGVLIWKIGAMDELLMWGLRAGPGTQDTWHVSYVYLLYLHSRLSGECHLWGYELQRNCIHQHDGCLGPHRGMLTSHGSSPFLECGGHHACLSWGKGSVFSSHSCCSGCSYRWEGVQWSSVPILRTSLNKDWLSTCHVPAPSEVLVALRLTGTTCLEAPWDTVRGKHTDMAQKCHESPQDAPAGLWRGQERFYPEGDI